MAYGYDFELEVEGSGVMCDQRGVSEGAIEGEVGEDA